MSRNNLALDDCSQDLLLGGAWGDDEFSPEDQQSPGSVETSSFGTGPEECQVKSPEEVNTGQVKGNSEACRKYRKKRKREMEDIQERNRILEDEREQLVLAIVDLTKEVNLLREEGKIDLVKENQLLKAQVQRHKVFIQDLICGNYLETSKTENELFKQAIAGVEGGYGQTLGLMYQSLHSTWSQGKSFELEGVGTITFMYQYLPNRENAVRLNVKFYSLDCGMPYMAANDRCWIALQDPRHLEHLFKGEKQFVKLDIPQDEDETSPFGQTSALRVVDDSEQVVLFTANKIEHLIPNTFCREDPNLERTPVSFNVQTTTNAGFAIAAQKENEGVLAHENKRLLAVESPQIKSNMFWPCHDNPSHCNMMCVGSFPLNNPAYADIMGFQIPTISEDGVVGEHVITEKQAHMQLMASVVVSDKN